MKRVNWTEKNVEAALDRIGKNQDFHARQQEFVAKAAERRAKKAAGSKGKGKKSKPKGPVRPDEIQLAVKKYTGYECKREHKFHPTRGWKFDYAIVELQIGLEKDGGIWREGGGAHSSPKSILRDMEKGNNAQVCGWLFLRLTPEQMGGDEMWRLLDLAIELQKSRGL